jgi:hypothetical protein
MEIRQIIFSEENSSHTHVFSFCLIFIQKCGAKNVFILFVQNVPLGLACGTSFTLTEPKLLRLCPDSPTKSAFQTVIISQPWTAETRRPDELGTSNGKLIVIPQNITHTIMLYLSPTQLPIGVQKSGPVVGTGLGPVVPTV